MSLVAALLLALPVQAVPRQTLMLTGFDRVRVDGPFEVEVTTGRSAGAVVEGDPAQQRRVSVRVEGSTLVIGTAPVTQDGFARASAPPRVRVTTPALTSAALTGGGRLALDRMEGQRVTLSLTGAGTLRVAALRADQLNATLVGSGTMAIAGTANKARFLGNGAGGFDAAGFTADDLSVRSEGAGASRFAARYTADVTATGSGSIDVGGSPACTTRGTATIRCGTTPRP